MEKSNPKEIENSTFMNTKSILHEILVINTILNNSNDTIYFKDIQSHFLLSSKAHAATFNEDNPADVIGKTDFDYFPEVFAQNAFIDEQNIIKTGIPLIGRLEKWVKPDGKILWFSASKYPLYDAEGKIIGTWGTSKDITAMKLAEEDLERLNEQLKEANRQLEILSSKDSLSGLFNHRHFYEEMKKLFDLYLRQKTKGEKKSSSIIVFDIDFFKKINDSHGHLVGDLTIKHVAETLVDSIRNSDTAFRYGGDEFVLLFNDTSNQEAKIAGEKIKENISKRPFIYGKSIINITISGGVASFDEAKDVNELLEKADKRLYQSKKSGRNKIT